MNNKNLCYQRRIHLLGVAEENEPGVLAVSCQRETITKKPLQF